MPNNSSRDGQRERIMEALARGDGQMLDGFDLGHTAEMMYGGQADAVSLLIAKEVARFANDVARDLRDDAGLTGGLPGAKHTRAALVMAARDVLLAARSYEHRAQSEYNETELAKPLALHQIADRLTS